MGSPKVPNDFKVLVSDPNATMCGNFINTLLKFPAVFYAFINWLLDSAGNFSAAVQRMIHKTGTRRESYAPLDEDAHWLLCDGREVLRADYPELFTSIGITYGTPSGVTVFKLPDARCRFPLPIGSLPSGGAVAIGGTGGNEKVSLGLDSVPKHRHRLFVGGSDGSTGAGHRETVQTVDNGHSGVDGAYLYTTDIDPDKADYIEGIGGDADGNSVPHDNMPPWQAVYVYIKT